MPAFRPAVLLMVLTSLFTLQRMAAKVEKEYRATKGQPGFVAMRDEFEYLHEKMAYIKTLVQEFDKCNLSAS